MFSKLFIWSLSYRKPNEGKHLHSDANSSFGHMYICIYTVTNSFLIIHECEFITAIIFFYFVPTTLSMLHKE